MTKTRQGPALASATLAFSTVVLDLRHRRDPHEFRGYLKQAADTHRAGIGRNIGRIRPRRSRFPLPKAGADLDQSQNGQKRVRLDAVFHFPASILIRPQGQSF